MKRQLRLKFPWRKQLDETAFDGLRARLQTTLVPVSPRKEFIQSIKKRLSRSYPIPNLEPSLALQGNKTLQYLLLGLLTLVSGTLLLITGIRAVIALLGVLGILHQVNRQMEETQIAPPLNPAI